MSSTPSSSSIPSSRSMYGSMSEKRVQ